MPYIITSARRYGENGEYCHVEAAGEDREALAARVRHDPLRILVCLRDTGRERVLSPGDRVHRRDIAWDVLAGGHLASPPSSPPPAAGPFWVELYPGCYSGPDATVVSRHGTWDRAVRQAIRSDRWVACDGRGRRYAIPPQNDRHYGSGRFGNGLTVREARKRGAPI